MLKPTDQLITGCSGEANESQRHPSASRRSKETVTCAVPNWLNGSCAAKTKEAVLVHAKWECLMPSVRQGIRIGKKIIVSSCVFYHLNPAAESFMSQMRQAYQRGNKAAINSALWRSVIVWLWSHLSAFTWSLQRSHTVCKDGYSDRVGKKMKTACTAGCNTGEGAVRLTCNTYKPCV